MNRVRDVDPINFSMIVEAGCILEAAQAEATSIDRHFPLAFGAQGSCQIGGAVATNAGGLNVLRYGMMRDLVLGLEVVLPDGRVWNDLRSLRKDNTGYDLKQLFLGSEGTLGIVTAAAVRLFPRPTQRETVFLAVESVASAMSLYAYARCELSDLLSAFELIPHLGVELAIDVMPGLRAPLDTSAPYYVLLEATASGLVDLHTLIERFLENMVREGCVYDGVIATNLAQSADLWRIREGMVEAQVRRGAHLRTDVSVKISSLAIFMDEVHTRLREAMPTALALAYGHVGDGNVHFNVIPPDNLTPLQTVDYLNRCEEIIFSGVDRFGGSISAEHGIGTKRRTAFLQRISAVQFDLSNQIKAALDPNGVMSPGRIFFERREPQE
jgi:FAD/FMN-containing dehydrogenase